MRRNVSFFALLLTFLVLGGAALRLQHQQLDMLRKRPNRFRDSLYLPSGNYVKLVSLGYDNFVADFLWLRVIQAFGAAYTAGASIHQLSSYFDVITDLDPRFLSAYSFGNLVLGEEAKDAARGLAILDKGIKNNPTKYRLGFEAAFFAYWTLEDAELAKSYVAKAVAAEDCPEYVRGWGAYLDNKMGRYHAAFENFFREFVHQYNGRNDQLAGLRYQNLRRSINEWIKTDIRLAAIEFYVKNSRVPTLSELEASGAFKEVEWPDWSKLDTYVREIEDKGGKFPDDDDELLRIAQQLIRKGWVHVPGCPESDNPDFPGYVIWPGQLPWFDGLRERDNPLFATSEIEAAEAVVKAMNKADATGDNLKKLNNGQCPTELAAVSTDLTQLLPLDPWGGKFIWDTSACKADLTGKRNFRQSYARAPRR